MYKFEHDLLQLERLLPLRCDYENHIGRDVQKIDRNGESDGDGNSLVNNYIRDYDLSDIYIYIYREREREREFHLLNEQKKAHLPQIDNH